MKSNIYTSSGFISHSLNFIACFFFFVAGLQAQNTWPDATQTGASVRDESGAALTDGGFFSIAGSSGVNLISLTKIRRDGQITKSGFISPIVSLYNPKGNLVIYDSTYQRLFIVNRSGNVLTSFFNQYDENIISNFQNPEYRLYGCICLDTSGKLLWAKRFLGPKDSVATISSAVLDGTGGIYLSGKSTGSILASVLPISPIKKRIEPGYNFITRIDRNGKVKWHLTQNEHPKSSILRGTAQQLMVVNPNHQVEWITTYADTTIYSLAFFTGNYKPNNYYQLNKTRIDTNGMVLRNQTGTLSSNFFGGESNSQYEILSRKIGNDYRYFMLTPGATYLSNYQNNNNSGLFELDTAFNILNVNQISGYFRSDLLIPSQDKLIIRGFRSDVNNLFGPTNSAYVYYIDYPAYTVGKSHLLKIGCQFGINYISPSIFLLKDKTSNLPNQDLLCTYASTNFVTQSNTFLKFKNTNELPCRGATLSNKPVFLTDIKGVNTLSWVEGGLPTLKGRNLYWKDTLLFGGMQANSSKKLIDFCKGELLNMLPNDTILCGDSIRLAVPLVRTKDVYELNGMRISDDTLFFTKAGKFLLTAYDTCLVSQPVYDSIQIRLATGQNINILPENIKLCPDQTETVQITIQPNTQYRWSPSAGLINSLLPIQTFRANSLQKGTTVYKLTATIGSCVSSDSIAINNLEAALGTITGENPDTILIVFPDTFIDFDWRINGGIVKGQSNGESKIVVNWGPYFNGQQAEVRFRASSGCLGTAVYIRPKPSETPEPDTTFLAFEFPNLITLNKDGKNDKFEILNVRADDQIEFQVYNRWGKLVYENKNYRNEFPVNEVENGMYFFISRLVFVRNGRARVLDNNGWLNIIK